MITRACRGIYTPLLSPSLRWHEVLTRKPKLAEITKVSGQQLLKLSRAEQGDRKAGTRGGANSMKFSRVEPNPAMMRVKFNAHQPPVLKQRANLTRWVTSASRSGHPQVPLAIVTQAQEVAISVVVEVLVELEHIVLIEVDAQVANGITSAPPG
eukprot:3687043-Amphidinium_carterae.3